MFIYFLIILYIKYFNINHIIFTNKIYEILKIEIFIPALECICAITFISFLNLLEIH